MRAGTVTAATAGGRFLDIERMESSQTWQLTNR